MKSEESSGFCERWISSFPAQSRQADVRARFLAKRLPKSAQIDRSGLFLSTLGRLAHLVKRNAKKTARPSLDDAISGCKPPSSAPSEPLSSAWRAVRDRTGLATIQLRWRRGFFACVGSRAIGRARMERRGEIQPGPWGNGSRPVVRLPES